MDELNTTNRTFLVVDDEPSLRKLVEKVLQQQGHRVLTAADGDEAMAMVKENIDDIDVLISDLVMPGISGGELAKDIQTLIPNIGVIKMSGHLDLSTSIIPKTVRQFLKKPFTQQELLDKVADTLTRI